MTIVGSANILINQFFATVFATAFSGGKPVKASIMVLGSQSCGDGIKLYSWLSSTTNERAAFLSLAATNAQKILLVTQSLARSPWPAPRVEVHPASPALLLSSAELGGTG